jgi:hypothetical protein
MGADKFEYPACLADRIELHKKGWVVAAGESRPGLFYPLLVAVVAYGSTQLVVPPAILVNAPLVAGN